MRAAALPNPRFAVARDAAPDPASASLSARVDRLARSGDPGRAFEAYWLLAQGWAAQQHLRSEPAKVCGDISPGQVGSRRSAFDIAAEADVHDAARPVEGRSADADNGGIEMHGQPAPSPRVEKSSSKNSLSPRSPPLRTAASCSRNWPRRILPEMVFGSSTTNSIRRTRL